MKISGSSLLLITLLGVQAANCTLKVVSPMSLVGTLQGASTDPKDVPYTLSTFGSIPYGMNIMGYAHFDPKNSYGCKPGIISPYSETDVMPFLIVRRGRCEFIVKVSVKFVPSEPFRS